MPKTKQRPEKQTKPATSARPVSRSRFRQTLPAAFQIKSILVPIDFSPASEKALAYALPLVRLAGAKLTLVHVVEAVATPDFISAFPLALRTDQIQQACQQRLRRVVQDLEIEPSLVEKLLVRDGRPFHEIASAARTLKSDLIVISTHGRTGLKHVLLGSTAERVVQHAPCPVLVVRPKQREFLKSIPKSKRG